LNNAPAGLWNDPAHAPHAASRRKFRPRLLNSTKNPHKSRSTRASVRKSNAKPDNPRTKTELTRTDAILRVKTSKPPRKLHIRLH
jgi:hypothetical protein